MTFDEATDAPETSSGRAPRWKPNPSAGNGGAAGGGAVYGLGMIGALVYFLLRAETGQEYLLALPKAMVWPALLVYRLFRSLES